MLDHSCQVQRHPHAERGHDLYETPAVAVEALLRVLELRSGAIWEPACGRGAIANVLRARGHCVVCTDLVDYDADRTAIYGVDFLKTTGLPPGVTTIVTNPPFKSANDFIAHAIELCPNVIMLGRLALLEFGTPVVGPRGPRAPPSIRLSQAAPDDASRRLAGKAR